MNFWTLLRSKHAPKRAAKHSLVALLAAGSWIAFPASTATAGRHPEPSVYPLPTAWYLSFQHKVPRRIVVAVPGQKVPTAYWYLPYTVTNNSGKEVDFLPDFEMVTQDGKVHPSDRNIPLPVFQAIKKDQNNELLITSAEIASQPLHQGEDQARDSVAIWEEPMQRMGSFSIYVGGLNSEFIAARDDKGEPIKDAEGRPITLRKTLELNYVIWGDEVKPELDDVQRKPQRWIMR